MGMASGCGEQEAGVASGSGWNLWVLLVGVVVRRYIYRFPHTTYPYSQHPYFLFIFFNLEEEERRRMPNHDFFFTSCSK